MKKTFLKSGSLFLLSLLLWLPLAGGGQASDVGKKPQQGRESQRGSKNNALSLTSSKEPIVIQADTMEVDYKRNRISYKGNITAVQGDTTLHSDTLAAEYADGFKELKEAVAQGHVRITQGERVASSGRAVFTQIREAVVMTENPTIRQGGSEVTGEKITLYLLEERTVVEGGGQRVKAIIQPDQMGSPKQ